MQRILIGLLAGLLSLLSATNAFSAEGDLRPSLVLNQIRVIAASESGGDELYFDIGIYQSNQPTQYLRIPKKPMHWSSAIVDKIKEVPLWSQSLKSGQAVTLIVSLIDRDRSSMNPDDLIGTIRVDLNNDKGHLKTRWSMPNRPASIGNKAMQKFDLMGEGRYEVSFTVK